MQRSVLAILKASLSILTTALLLLGLVVVLSSARTGTSLIGAQASSIAPTPGPPSADPGALPTDTEAALWELAPGTVIVDCLPGMARLPEGIMPSRAAGWSQMHPGFFQLPHGYCADNPSATPIPIRPDSADPPGAPP